MFFTILLLFGISAGCILAGKILIHYFQLESYQFHHDDRRIPDRQILL